MYLDAVKVERNPLTPYWVIRVLENSGYRPVMVNKDWIVFVNQ